MKLCPSCHNGLVGVPPACPLCQADLGDVAEIDGGALGGMVVADRYRLTDVLGEGAMGWVYRALHVGLDRPVAIKLLKHAGAADHEAVARFEQEARAASRLHHPHIVTIIDFGRTPGGLLYIVTELIEGSTLDELIYDQGSLEVGRAFALFHQVMAAVEEAHWAHVIHRDLKPENIAVAALRSGDEFVKVLDFGIATLADEPSKRLTAGGGFVGTPGFMAPETIREGRADERSDIYALGAILFELLVGRPPFDSEWPMALLSMHLNDEPPRLCDAAPERGFPKALECAVARALAKDPAERYDSVAELRAEVTRGINSMGQIDLGCQQCAQPRDQLTGLCKLHGSSAPAPSSRRRAVGVAVAVDATSRTLVARAVPDRASLVKRLAAGTGSFSQEAEAVGELLLGDTRVIEVVCPLGAGERRVLALARAGAESLGWRVLTIQSDPRYALRPWYPVRRLVGGLLGCGPEPASGGTLVGAAPVARLERSHLAGLHLLFGLPCEDLPGSRRERWEAIHRAVVAVLELDAATAEGTLLVGHDLHEFDRASQGLLRALVGGAPRLRLRLCASAEGGLWSGDGACVHLRPRPLDESAVGELVDRAGAGGETDLRYLSQRIVAQTGGERVAVEQAVAVFAEGGDIAGDLERLVARRLERLPGEACTVFATLCAIGRDVALPLLERTTEGDVVPLAANMLVRAGLATVGEERRLSPAHPALRRVALAALPSGERQLMHRRIVRVLEGVGASPFVLAHHAFEGELADEALDLIETVAGRACAWSDEETAGLVHYRHALHVARWRMLLGDDDPRVLGLSLELAEALIASGHHRAAEVVLREVEGARVLPGAVAARASRALADLGLADRRPLPVDVG